jgi:hypothetical protein
LNSVYSQWRRSLNDIRRRISILEHPRAHDARQKVYTADSSMRWVIPSLCPTLSGYVYTYFAFKCTIRIAWFPLFKILLISLWRAVIRCSCSACNNIIVDYTYHFCKLYNILMYFKNIWYISVFFTFTKFIDIYIFLLKSGEIKCSSFTIIKFEFIVTSTEYYIDSVQINFTYSVLESLAIFTL